MLANRRQGSKFGELEGLRRRQLVRMPMCLSMTVRIGAAGPALPLVQRSCERVSSVSINRRTRMPRNNLLICLEVPCICAILRHGGEIVRKALLPSPIRLLVTEGLRLLGLLGLLGLWWELLVMLWLLELLGLLELLQRLW